MKSDVGTKKKVGIFDRLEQTKTGSTQQRVQITGVNSTPTTSASIFSRLGGKSDDIDLDDEEAMAFAGILKSAPKKVTKNMPIGLISIVSSFIFYSNLNNRLSASRNWANRSKKRF